MSVESRIRRLNNLLGAELGYAPTGLPLFQWLWSESESLIHPARVVYPDGSRKYDYVCSCGTNIRDGEHRGESGWTGISGPSCNRAVQAVPVYAKIRICCNRRNFHPEHGWGEMVANQWILCKWLAPPSESDFSEEFGSALHWEHYRRGTYEPVSQANNAPVALPPGELPDKDLTQLVIQRFKQHQHEQEKAGDSPEDPFERHYQETRSHLRDAILDATRFFGKPRLAGKKDGVSFRQVPGL